MPIYSTLLKVPPGKTISYGELARRVGTHPRVVGMAMRFNRLLLFVPCHRVIREDGGLGGFSSGIELKEWLLRHEGCEIVIEGG